MAVRRGSPQMKELINRQQHLRRATLGSLLGGFALFASGGGVARAEDGFETTSSGLKYKILKEGTGAIPAAGKLVEEGRFSLSCRGTDWVSAWKLRVHLVCWSAFR